MKRILILALTLAPTAAFAHPGHGADLVSGLNHPFLGADHLLAMTGVGLWAAQQQGRARIALPLAFLIAMAAGFALTLPAFEPVVLASVILLGAAITLALRAPLHATLPVITVFGLAHGAAHGAAGNGPAFALGAIIATAALHAFGATLGVTLNRTALRSTGALTLVAGLSLAMAS